MINTSKVKIFLLNAYSNYDSYLFFISGSDRVALELASEDKANSIIIGPSTLKKIIPDGLTFISSQNFYTKVLIFDYLIRTFNTIRILKNLEFSDYIVSSSDFFCDVIPGALFSMGKKWIVFTFHLYPDFNINKSLRNLIGRILQDISYFLFRFSESIFTTNSESLEYLKVNYCYKNILKIPLGIHIEHYNSKKNKNIDIIFLGRIKESKGIFELPEIISIVKTKYNPIKAVVVGNGPEKERSRLVELDLKYNSNLDFLGSVSDEELRDLLSRSKILIQLDSEGGFGLNILEACASGCFVVGYNLPAYEENFKDLNLKMSPQKDKKGVAKNIINILNSNKNLNLNFNKLSRFDWKEIYKIIFSY